MYMKQISVFVENQMGQLAAFSEMLARENIDLAALSVADTADFGIFRCIVWDYERALAVIREGGYSAQVTEVLAVSVPDAPGGMAGAIRALTDAGISIEYMYSFVRRAEQNALLILRVSDVQKAAKALLAAGFTLLTHAQVETL